MVTVEESERTSPAFSDIDWDNNAEWKDYLGKFDLGTAKNVEAEENRLKLKWYRKTYDSNFTPYKASSSTPAAEASRPASGAASRAASSSSPINK